MKNAERLFCIVLCVVLLTTAFSGCKKTEKEIENPEYTSFREIPDITADEIAAVERLKGKYDSFVFGAMTSTEAFVDGGNINGFASLVCDWLTEIFEIQFTPKLYEWGWLVGGINDKSIDFTGELTATEERRQNGYLMTDSITERPIKIMRLKNSMPLFEISAARTLRYAFLDGTTTFEEVTALSQEEFEAILIDGYEKAYNLLKEGLIDGFIDEGPAEEAFDDYGDVVSENFLPMIYSPVSLTTCNPELEPIITVVQKLLKTEIGIKKLSDLHLLGEQEYAKHKLLTVLTDEEFDYIEKKPTIKYVAEYNNYPISFYNPKENAWQGIFFDVLDEVTQLTGLTFELVNSSEEEWPNILEMVENGEVSMISELIHTRERDKRFLWPDSSLLTVHYALLSKSDIKNIKINEIQQFRIGIANGTAHAELFRSWFPTHPKTTEYATVELAFEALEKGEVDMVMSSTSQLLILTNYHERVGYKANVVFERVLYSTVGFYREEEVLCSIMDKSLSLIDVGVISSQWTRKVFDYRAKLALARLPWTIGAAVLMFCILVLVFVIFQKNRREGKKLERLVHERTIELETASRAKSDFLSNMSHEMRTPMNAIIGMTTIAKNADNVERIHYTIDKISEASSHLLGVINDILDMSKIEAGKFELSPTEFNFEKMLQSVVNVSSFRVDEKCQNLTVYVDRDIPPFLIGDDQHLSQVITNLLSNAVKFTPEEGTINLNTYYKGEEDGVCTIEISVKDTGIGISPEQQEILFQSFQQADNNTSRKFGGTGLGLVISKNIVEMMGGKIRIESELGKGATFIFSIKIERSDRVKEPEKVKIEWKNIKVLAVDDNKHIIQDFKGIIEKFGASCDIASNSDDALALLEGGNQYNLLFVDWKMPGIDGVELTKKFRAKMTNRNDSFVIMVSAADWAEIKNKAVDAGVDRFLSKPLFPSVIREMVQDCIDTNEESENKNTQPVFEGSYILLAEDIEINREIVVTLLEPTKINIICAEDGAEAVRLFKEEPSKFSIIFMDMQMPVMDGLEATRQIRAIDTEEAKNIPIVAMTANVFKEDVDKCIAAGMNAHIGKPIDFNEVIRALQNFIK